MSKKGFLFGLAVGGAAIVTLAMKMDDEKKAELKAKAQRGIAEFKDRAIDYAFYANDAAEDFKTEASQHFAEAKDKVSDLADQYQTAKSDGDSFGSNLDAATDSLRSELEKVEDDESDQDDIVIDSADAFEDSDAETPASDAATDEAASEAPVEPTSAAEDATSQADEEQPK